MLVFIPGSNVWTVTRSFFFGIFGLGMLLVPPFFVYLCVINEKEKQIAHFGAKVALCVMIAMFAGALVFAINWGKYSNMGYFAALGNLYLDCFGYTGYIPPSCGLIGGVLGYPITVLCGQPVAIIITIVLLAAMIFLITNLSVKDVARAASRTANRVKRASEERRQRRQERAAEKLESNYGGDVTDSGRKRDGNKRKSSDIDIPIYISGQKQNASDIDIPLDEPKRRRKTKKEAVNTARDIDIDYTDSNEKNAADLDLSGRCLSASGIIWRST